MSAVRWGVLSTANIGRRAVNPAIQASDAGQLLAVASRSQERAEAFATEHGIPQALGSYEAMVSHPGLDALYIPLPNSMHKQWVIRAAEAGKHVLCEKPLGLTALECLDMDAAARANGTQLMEAFMYRFHPRAEALFKSVRQGDLGDLRSIQSAFTFKLTRLDNIRLDPELGGGALMDVGCYCVNVSRTLAGAEPVQVRATARWTERDVDAELHGTLYFENHVTAQIGCALTQARRETVEVAGTDAWIRVPGAFLPGTGEVSYSVNDGGGAGAGSVVSFEGTDQYLRMVEHFQDCVRGGRGLRYPALEAARNMAVMDALYASARAGGDLVPVRILDER